MATRGTGGTEYVPTVGGAAQPSGPTATATPPPSGRGAWLRNASAAAAQRKGLPYLAHDDPTQILLWQVAYNLTPEQARQASEQGATRSVRQGGTALDDYAVDEIGYGVRGGRNAPDRYDPAYDVGSAVRQAVNTASQTRTFTGPDDPQLLGIIQQAAGTAGTTLTPEQARQLADFGYRYTRGTGQRSGTETDNYYDWLAGQATQRKLLEGHQMNPATWDSMGDYGRALYLSAIGRSGRDQTEWQQKLNASRPQGTAPRTGTTDFAQNLAGVY
jgi:hypothetical protein